MDELACIREKRLSLLPRYTYDWDEDEKTLGEYEVFYRENIDKCIQDTTKYLYALKSLKGSKSSLSVDEVIVNRAQFILSFPFCEDQIESYKEDDDKDLASRCVESMKKTYLKNTSDNYDVDRYGRYLEDLQIIKIWLQKNS